MVNYHHSRIHRLPPEMLVAVVSHLKDDASLVTATHVCHLWRIALLSSPRLWSHLDFSNEERTLVFLERSKSTPLNVDLTKIDRASEVVRESLNKITTRVTTLGAAHDSFLYELLTQPMPILEGLEISDSYAKLPLKEPTHLPSLTSLVISCFEFPQFHVPLLTSFHLTHVSTSRSMERKLTAGSLLDFFRNCPLLEVVLITCHILETHPDSDEVVSLPFLRSFTHKSPRDGYQLFLFNQLSLPSTCRVVLVIDVTMHDPHPWIPGLPTLGDPPFLPDIKTVKITARPHGRSVYKESLTFKVELTDSTRGAISFDRISYHPHLLSTSLHDGFLYIFGSIELDSVETLCFDRFPLVPDERPRTSAGPITRALGKFRNLKTLILVGFNVILFLDAFDPSSCPPIDTLVVSPRRDSETGSLSDDIIRNRLEEFALSRKKAGSPLQTLTIVYPFAELRPSKLEWLKRCVRRVEVVDAFKWDVDAYLLGAATHEGSASRF